MLNCSNEPVKMRYVYRHIHLVCNDVDVHLPLNCYNSSRKIFITKRLY